MATPVGGCPARGGGDSLAPLLFVKMAFQGVPRRPLAHLVALAGVPVRNVGSEEHAWEDKSGNVSAAHARSSGPALLLLTQGQGLGRWGLGQEAWWG